MSFLRQLVQSTLRATKRPAGHATAELEVALFGDATGPGARAVAYGGQGLDLANGECLLAAVGTYMQPQGFHHRLAAAITNRRTICGGWSSTKGNLNEVRTTILHDEVTGVDVKKGMLTRSFDVLTMRGPQNLVHLVADLPEIEGFFRGLLQLPLGHRAEPATPMPAPCEGDPIAAHAAVASLWYPDDRAVRLLGALHHAYAAETMDVHTAIDLVGRIVLAHRAICSGPAGWGNGYLSALSADDLGNVLCGALGQPLRHKQPDGATHWLDFPLDPRRDTLSPALKALGIASFVGIGIGFSPSRMLAAEMLRKPPLTAIRCVFADMPGGCAYELYGNGRRLETIEAEMCHGIHQLLVHAAWPVLERRCQFGWQPAYSQMFA